MAWFAGWALLLSALALSAATGTATANGADNAATAATDGENCASIGAAASDTFNENLKIRRVPHTEMFLAQFEFIVGAPVSPAFRANQFDLFPKPVGKLLNAHRSIIGFEATLTQGRWKEDEWGPSWMNFRPPGGTLVTATNATGEGADTEQEEAWRFLLSTVSGTICASFEGMDKNRKQTSYGKPMDSPWVAPGVQLRMATLPYEPMCTENLTPWLKLLPCGAYAGLASLLSPLAIAESPLKSLSLFYTAENSPDPRVVLRGSLDVVLPMQKVGSGGGNAAWFGNERNFPVCVAAKTSTVKFWTAIAPNFDSSTVLSEHVSKSGDGFVLSLPALAVFGDSSDFVVKVVPEDIDAPWTVPSGGDGSHGQDRLSVLRDILSVEGKSERRYGRYLLRLSNAGTTREVYFMDQLPFFLRPFWQTFHASFWDPSRGFEELAGINAMQRLGLKFTPSDGDTLATDVSFSVQVAPGGVVNVYLDVLKEFLSVKSFSYACEKGFDVSSAAWFERKVNESQDSQARNQFQTMTRADLTALFQDRGSSPWRLRFTEGILVLVPMPDFSMPFNVIAFSVTVMVTFFGVIFRNTSDAKPRHWVLLKEQTDELQKHIMRKKWTKRFILLFFLAFALACGMATDEHIVAIRECLPHEFADIIIGVLESVRPHANVWLKAFA